MWERVPTWPSHPGSLHRPASLELFQLLINLSVLYLPDNILAETTALLTSNGLPAVVQIGCGVERDMNDGLKNSSESICCATPLYFICHESSTLFLVRVFH